MVARAPYIIEVQISKLLRNSMAEILAQRQTGMDIIILKYLLTTLYQQGLLMTGIYLQLYTVLARLGHANLNMRCIEIGGGTGGATRITMRAFRANNGIKSYLDYTFTDIPPEFLATAREALSTSRLGDMKFNMLNVEEDPISDGYEPVYDVVIVCQVLLATSNMHNILINIGKLLKPGERLVLVETT